MTRQLTLFEELPKKSKKLSLPDNKWRQWYYNRYWLWFKSTDPKYYYFKNEMLRTNKPKA